MKTTVFFSRAVAILFSSILFLAGCGGASNVSSSAPLPPPTGASSAHGTFIYVRNDNSRTGTDGSISGFRMNRDGTLTALHGSPFSINGNLAVLGNFLLVADCQGVTSSRIDPLSGSLTPAAHTATSSGIGFLTVDPIAVDSGNVYRGARDVIYGFSIDDNGAFAAISGSPFSFGPGNFVVDSMSIGVQNSFLFASGSSVDVSGLAAYKIRNGALVYFSSEGEAPDVLTLERSGTVAFAAGGSVIESFVIDEAGTLRPGSKTLDNSGNVQALAIDPTGKFLAAIDTTALSFTDSHVAVFSIDPVTNNLTELGAPVATGEPGGSSITFDPSGRFILITHGGDELFSNDLTVFSFDPASGTVTRIQSGPTGTNPGSVVVASF